MTPQRKSLLQQTFRLTALKLHNSTGISFRECKKHMAGADIEDASEMSFDNMYLELEAMISKAARKFNLIEKDFKV